MNYIENYGQWYCYSCVKYLSELESANVPAPEVAPPPQTYQPPPVQQPPPQPAYQPQQQTYQPNLPPDVIGQKEQHLQQIYDLMQSNGQALTQEQQRLPYAEMLEKKKKIDREMASLQRQIDTYSRKAESYSKMAVKKLNRQHDSAYKSYSSKADTYARLIDPKQRELTKIGYELAKINEGQCMQYTGGTPTATIKAAIRNYESKQRAYEKEAQRLEKELYGKSQTGMSGGAVDGLIDGFKRLFGFGD